MGKTYRRDQSFRPRKQGRVFSKDDQSWKKHKKDKRYVQNDNPKPDSEYTDIDT